MSKIRSLGLVAVPATLMGFVASVQAAVPEGITTAIETMQADGVTIATAVLVAVIAVLAFKFLRKAF